MQLYYWRLFAYHKYDGLYHNFPTLCQHGFCGSGHVIINDDEDAYAFPSNLDLLLFDNMLILSYSSAKILKNSVTLCDSIDSDVNNN